MVTPAKGDYQSVPLNAEARRIADAWDPSKDGACEAYGAPALMRLPGRLHITWEDDNTLKIETDAGQQTRLLRFGPSTLQQAQGRPEQGRGTTSSEPSRAESRDGAARPPGGERTLQGHSVADWGRGGGGGGGFGGFGGNVAPPDQAAARGAGAPPVAARGGPPAAPAPAAAAPAGRGRGGPQRWAPLNVVTTQLRPGWLRKNGVPYSENTVVTEHFIRFADESDEWFTVVTTVEDPTYLTMSFITSTNFKREPDGCKFKPTPCKAG